MNSTSYDHNSSSGIIPMAEAIEEKIPNQPLTAITTTTTDINITNEEKHHLLNQDNPSSGNHRFFCVISHVKFPM